MLTHFALVYGYLHATMAEVSGWDRNCRGSKLKIFAIWFFWKKVSHVWSACPTLLPEGLLSLADSLCEGSETGYLPSFFQILQKDVS